MKFIAPVVDFNHNHQQYFVGEIRKVDDGLAGYFCGVGWAKDEVGRSGAPDLSEKTLKIDNISHKSSAPSIGVNDHG